MAQRYVNDETGAPAYDPAVMLKIVLLAYSRGIISSRAIERLCRENVLFMAISGDSAPRSIATSRKTGFSTASLVLRCGHVARVVLGSSRDLLCIETRYTICP